jgi:hypothetical protein
VVSSLVKRHPSRACARHAEHYAMPYVDWLPYEVRALKWLAERYTYDGSELKAK